MNIWFSMTKEQRIIFLTDIIETKVRKEKELEFYQKELEKLQVKMFYVRKEIDLTNTIIDIIENEKVLDIRDNVHNKFIESKKDEQ